MADYRQFCGKCGNSIGFGSTHKDSCELSGDHQNWLAKQEFLEHLKSRNFREISSEYKIYGCLWCGVVVWGMDLHRIDCTSVKATVRAENIPPRCKVCQALIFEDQPHAH